MCRYGFIAEVKINPQSKIGFICVFENLEPLLALGLS